MKRWKVPFELKITGSIEVDAVDEPDARQFVESLGAFYLYDRAEIRTKVKYNDVITEWPTEVSP